MIFQHFLVEAHESNVYVAGCEETGEAILIDAGSFDRRVVDFVRQRRLTVKAILITHGHWDHTGGEKEYEIEFNCMRLGAGRLREGESFNFGKLSARILKTTGHTPDSFSFYIPAERAVFTGDALFAGSIGGTSNDAQKAEEIANIRAKILSLPEDTVIFPGHGPASTVGAEKRHNPFLRIEKP